jgi:hypothetical protein
MGLGGLAIFCNNLGRGKARDRFGCPSFREALV